MNDECRYCQSLDAGKGKCGHAGNGSRIQVCPYGCLSPQGLNHLTENFKLCAYVDASFLFVLFCFIEAVCFHGFHGLFHGFVFIQTLKQWAL